MKVLVDTCIWSLALRRDQNDKNALVFTLRELINDVRVQMIGSIRQEILSGIKSKTNLNDLKVIFQHFLIYLYKQRTMNLPLNIPISTDKKAFRDLIQIF